MSKCLIAHRPITPWWPRVEQYSFIFSIRSNLLMWYLGKIEIHFLSTGLKIYNFSCSRNHRDECGSLKNRLRDDTESQQVLYSHATGAAVWMGMSVFLSLWAKLKYLDNYLKDFCEILYRYSWSQRMNPNNSSSDFSYHQFNISNCAVVLVPSALNSPFSANYQMFAR